MNKSVENTLLQRRSIRRYERQDITNDDLEFIYEAIRNTPTSYNGQQFSVIDISNQDLKEQIYEITGQKQIKTCNHFLVFCADYNKISLLAAHKGVDSLPFTETVDGYTVGVIDATLAMMSALVVAESRGLGTCCIGYTRTAAPAPLSQLLNLPQRVCIVCGLSIGVPREMPDLKPKQPATLLIHHNSYRQDDMLPELIDYDNTVKHYNTSRAGSKSTNDWALHIVSYYKEGENYNMRQAMQQQGFLKLP